MNKLRFFFNGIKASDGKLQKCWYSTGPLLNSPAGTITIYAERKQHSFSADVSRAFEVENNSDIMTDYFESDRIRVRPGHPLYAEVKAMAEKASARQDARIEAQTAKMIARQVAA